MTGGGQADQIDRRVHTALAGLAEAVPDHGDQFWQILGTQLIAERNSPAAPTFDPLERLERADHRADPPPEASAASRRDRKRDRTPTEARSDGPARATPNVSQLAEHAEWIKQRPSRWRRRASVITCAAGTAVVLGLAVWFGATAEHGAPPPSAGRIAQLMSQRVTSSPYVLGGVETVGLGAGTGRYAFVRSAAGSFRYRRLDRRGDTAYDALTGAAQSWRVRRDGSISASADTGLASGPPDPDGVNRYLSDDELGLTIRALEVSPHVIAHTRTRDGHKQWVIDLHPDRSSDAPVDRMQVIVDQSRQLPVEISRSVRGTLVHRTQFANLRMQSTVRDDTFRLAPPAQINPQPLDNGFRLSKLPDATSVVGYTPATPGWLPAGYELSGVAVLAGSPAALPATGGGDNPPNRDVASVSYRRGVDRLTVTTRRTSGPGDVWKDPFSASPAAGARAQRVRLDGGRFVGTMVELVTAPGAVPHLWGQTSDVVFTVAGDLVPSQLLRVASSLR